MLLRLAVVLLVIGIILIVVSVIPPLGVAYLLAAGIVIAALGAGLWLLLYLTGGPRIQ